MTSAAFDARLKALEERSAGDRATIASARSIEQMVEELRQQVRPLCRLRVPHHSCCMLDGAKLSYVACILWPAWLTAARDAAQVSSCCSATFKLGAEQSRLGRVLTATVNIAELAEAKSDALAAEIARQHKMLRRCRAAQQENCHVSRSQRWKSTDACALRHW